MTVLSWECQGCGEPCCLDGGQVKVDPAYCPWGKHAAARWVRVEEVSP